MKKIILVAASVLAISCSAQTGIAHETAPAPYHEKSGTLYVSATGQVSQAPDQASVSAGVVTQAPDAASAMRQNAAQMSAAFKALKEAGIKQRDIQTSQMSLRPQYDRENRKAPRITGYEVRNTVTARTEKLEKVGAMLDALVSAGINNINGVTFSIRDSKSAKDKARLEAISAARIKAQAMAKAAGVSLGKVLEIRENTGGFRPEANLLQVRAFSDASPTPIAAGEQTLSVTVNISYALDQ